MKNGLTPLWNDDDLEQWYDIFIDRTEEKTYLLLAKAGELFVKYARENGGYSDQTGNLRSSIGYLIVCSNEILSENFEQSDKGTDRTTGLGKARQLAMQIGSSHPSGWLLICVAGMNYAASVEARGKDVITGSVTAMEEDLRKQIDKVFSKANGYGR